MAGPTSRSSARAVDDWPMADQSFGPTPPRTSRWSFAGSCRDHHIRPGRSAGHDRGHHYRHPPGPGFDCRRATSGHFRTGVRRAGPPGATAQSDRTIAERQSPVRQAGACDVDRGARSGVRAPAGAPRRPPTRGECSGWPGITPGVCWPLERSATSPSSAPAPGPGGGPLPGVLAGHRPAAPAAHFLRRRGVARGPATLVTILMAVVLWGAAHPGGDPGGRAGAATGQRDQQPDPPGQALADQRPAAAQPDDGQQPVETFTSEVTKNSSPSRRPPCRPARPPSKCSAVSPWRCSPRSFCSTTANECGSS